jgi:citrate lyase subunit beta/citryl-CoA lyase
VPVNATVAAAPSVRSALFVPGHRADFLSRLDRFSPDAVIIDLEDAVASSAKDEARRVVGGWIQARPGARRPAICVRINALGTGQLMADLEAIVHPDLTAVVLPKVERPRDVVRLADALSYVEGRCGLAHGSVRIWPLVESARAVQRAGAIARASGRIAYMGGGGSQRGDLPSSIGYRWTASGSELLYIRSKLLVDARAAGVPNPVTGLVSSLHDLDEVRAFALMARALGYEGMMVIHPSHVAVVNDVFSASAEEVAEARGLLDALRTAAERGDGAAAFGGQMVDVAMADMAAKVLERAATRGTDPSAPLTEGGVPS